MGAIHWTLIVLLWVLHIGHWYFCCGILILIIDIFIGSATHWTLIFLLVLPHIDHWYFFVSNTHTTLIFLLVLLHIGHWYFHWECHTLDIDIFVVGAIHWALIFLFGRRTVYVKDIALSTRPWLMPTFKRQTLQEIVYVNIYTVTPIVIYITKLKTLNRLNLIIHNFYIKYNSFW